MKRHIKIFFAFLCAACFSVIFFSPYHASATSKITSPITTSLNTFAITSSSELTAGDLEMFSYNNILFYEPECEAGDDCAPPTGDQVTWIGDSYSLGLKDIFAKKLAGVDAYFMGCKHFSADISPSQATGACGNGEGSSTIDGLSGNPSGITIAKKLKEQNKLRPYLAFELGTNDPGGKKETVAGWIKDLQEAVGSGTKIILMTAHTSDGSDYSKFNAAVKEAAEKESNIALADWEAAINGKESQYLSGDNVHPNSSGGEVLVDTFVSALQTLADCNTGGCAKLGELRTAMWKAASDYDRQSFMKTVCEEDCSIAGVEGYMNQAISYKNSNGDLAKWLDGQCEAFRPSEASCRGNHTISSEEQSWIDQALAGSNNIHFAVGNASEGVGVGKLVCLWDKNQNQCADLDYKSFTKGIKCNEVPGYKGGVTECWGLELAGDWAEEMEKSCGSSGSSTTGGNSTSTSSNSTLSNGKDYAGNEVFSEDELKNINNLKPLYQKAVEGTGIDWQALAAIHRAETGNDKSNTTKNDDGPFQIIDHSYCPSCVWTPGHQNSDDEFLAHAKAAIKVFQAKQENKTLDHLGYKYTFFGYNGRAGVYVSQARDLGFSEEEAKVGEGSPYVMNFADEKRDPTKNTTQGKGGWGQIKEDNGPIEYPANTSFHGLFIMCQTLGGCGGNGGGDNCPTKECSNTSGEKIAKIAVEASWSYDEREAHRPEPTPKYQELLNQYNPTTAADCGHFVATMILASGLDSDYPKGGTSTQEDYVKKSDKWTLVKEKWNPSQDGAEGLQPGDVAIKDGHTLMYVGDIGKDKGGDIAEASQDDWSGEIQKVSGKSNGPYRVYRLSGSSDPNCDVQGLTEEQAQKLVDYYNSDKVKGGDLPSGTKCNCYSMSVWFLRDLTTIETSNPHTEGASELVKGLVQKETSVKYGSEPKVFSIFSVSTGVTMCSGGVLCGHTGVVVGTDGDDFITIEAAYGNCSFTGVKKRPKSYFVNTGYPGYEFAYITESIKQKELNEIIK